MKIFVKTLKGSHFEIQVQPEDSVADVKRNIETVQGADVYPAAQQMLIHQGKVLKDGTTLDENKVAENSFIVIMLTKNKSSSAGASSTPPAAPVSKASQSTAPAPAPVPTPAPVSASPPVTTASEVPSTTSVPPATTADLSPPATTPAPAPAPAPSTTLPESDVYSQAASNLVAGTNLEESIQQILLIGGGVWDRDTVVRALRAAYNNPERAIDYLYSGIPEQAEVPPPVQIPSTVQATNPSAQPPQPAQPASVPSSTGPNANPLDLFPQGLPNIASGAVGSGNLDFLRNSPQFQALRAMVRANPQILQPMLQELGKQNPQLIRLIQDHQPDFLRLINEPLEGEGNILGQLASEAVPQTVTVTAEEREAIQRLEELGFDRALVLEVFFACNKNEELAANYLLDHIHEFEDPQN